VSVFQRPKMQNAAEIIAQSPTMRASLLLLSQNFQVVDPIFAILRKFKLVSRRFQVTLIKI
jgi:hypothetical protein